MLAGLGSAVLRVEGNLLVGRAGNLQAAYVAEGAGGMVVLGEGSHPKEGEKGEVKHIDLGHLVARQPGLGVE